MARCRYHIHDSCHKTLPVCSYTHRTFLQIFLYFTMGITVLPTIEHTKLEILNSPSIGNIIDVISNKLRTLHAIAYTDYIIEDNDTFSRDPYMILYVCVCVTFMVFTDCKSCTRPISTSPGSMEASEYGLTRGTCFVARRLEVVAVAGLLRISWCVWSAAGFRVSSVVYFSSNAHGLLQV